MQGAVREHPIEVLSDGMMVSSVLHLPAGSGPHPAVLCLHGLAGMKGFFTVLARRLAAAGIACLRIDFRGCGDSSGLLEEMTLETQMQDAEAAAAALRGRMDIRLDSLGVLGFSMGGGVASLTAGRLMPRCLGLWAPLLSLTKYTEGANPAWSRLDGGRMLLWDGHVAGPGLFESCRRHHPLPAAEAYPRPVFVAHGALDESIPQAGSRAFEAARRAAGLPVEALYLPRCGHMFEAPPERAALYAATEAFFIRHLMGAS